MWRTKVDATRLGKDLKKDPAYIKNGTVKITKPLLAFFGIVHVKSLSCIGCTSDFQSDESDLSREVRRLAAAWPIYAARRRQDDRDRQGHGDRETWLERHRIKTLGDFSKLWPQSFSFVFLCTRLCRINSDLCERPAAGRRERRLCGVESLQARLAVQSNERARAFVVRKETRNHVRLTKRPRNDVNGDVGGRWHPGAIPPAARMQSKHATLRCIERRRRR
jgi:hypothetical protein